MKIFKVLLVIVLLGGLGAGIYYGNDPLPAPTEPVLLLPSFGEAPTLGVDGFIDYSSRFLAVAEAGYASNATQEEKLEAAYAIYRMGCYTYSIVPYKAERSFGGGSAATADEKFGGYMDVYSRFFQMKTSDDKYYHFSERYSQLYKAVGVPPNIGIAVGSFITFAEKETNTNEGKTFWEGKKGSAVIDGNGATGAFKTQDIVFKTRAELDAKRDKDIADGKRRVYPEDWYDEYGHDAPEKTQHTINKDTILPESIVITKAFDKNNAPYYNVKFDVICNEESTGFEAKGIMETSTLIKSLTYDYLRVEMEVYESGYMRRWSSQESWRGRLNIIISEIIGVTASDADTYISYDKNVIMAGLQQCWFGDYTLDI